MSGCGTDGVGVGYRASKDLAIRVKGGKQDNKPCDLQKGSRDRILLSCEMEEKRGKCRNTVMTFIQGK